ncbi:MAG: ABC transporter ATP-binding protein [Planctomycetes bacterium]|nr:ABC transporter ATP-binding protein [Planctomycetota bacterium]
MLSPTRHTYRQDYWALRDVSFDVPKGRTYGILGANGAGKSTLLKILAGRLRQTSGTIEVEGRVNGILELGTGLQPTLTGRQNARVNALFLGLDPWRIEDQLDRILEFAELGDYADQPLDTYSSGMKSRLAFSVLTALEPEVLVLDEALAAGDSGFSQKCTRFIHDLCNNSGCTVLVVSHDMEFMRNSCQHLLWFEHGKVHSEGPPEQIVSGYLESFGGAEVELSNRPRYLLFRVTPEDPAQQLDYELQCVSWLAPVGSLREDSSTWRGEGHPFVHYGLQFLGHDAALFETFRAAGVLGVTQRTAREVWGPVRTIEEQPPYRRLSPHRGPGGVAYLGLPVPQYPLPPPSGIRMFGINELATPLVLSVQVDGAWHELGKFGTPELSVEQQGHYLASHPFDLKGLMDRFADSFVGGEAPAPAEPSA